MATTRPAALRYLRQPVGGWLRSPAWDLTFISLSAVLVGLPFAAFQGFNAWHSFQYLGLTWYANRLASDRNQTMSAFTRRLSGPGDGWRFYGLLVLCTIGAGVIIGVLLLLRGPLGLTPEQPFYMTMLSFLLIHYYHDHVLFTDPEAIVAEHSAAVAISQA